MIKIINRNTGAINYFVDMTYTHAFIRKNGLEDLYKANMIFVKKMYKTEILNEIFDSVFFLIEKTNSKFSINFNKDVLKICFKDIGIIFIVDLHKPKITTNVQHENSSVVIGKYSLFRIDQAIYYHTNDYIIGNKNNNSEILKSIIYGTNNKSDGFWNIFWNNCKRRFHIHKRANNTEATRNTGFKS